MILGPDDPRAVRRPVPRAIGTKTEEFLRDLLKNGGQEEDVLETLIASAESSDETGKSE